MRPWLIIPVKSLAHGKSRLARVLSAPARRRLNELLLRRMLAVAVRFPGVRRTVVISGCEEARAVAEEYRVIALCDPPRRGLNAAASRALRSVRARGATAVMLAACDLPRLRAADLRALARAGAALTRGLLLCSDVRGAGTNALYLAAGAALRFRFGRASLCHHLREARRRGLPVQLHRNAHIAADVDTPGELQRWQRERRRRRQLRRGVALDERREPQRAGGVHGRGLAAARPTGKKSRGSAKKAAE